MKWYKHDADAHMDAKLRKFRLRYGMEGYGLYWFCLELIARNVEKYNLTFELEHDSELIAHDTGLHRDQIEEMMRYMVELGLFEQEGGGVITCLKMATRTDEYTQKLIKVSGSVGRVSRQTPASVDTKSVLIEEKRREQKRFIPPSVEDVTEYVKTRDKKIDPQQFVDHYEASGWLRGKNKIKDWKACVRTWERNDHPDNNKNQQQGCVL